MLRGAADRARRSTVRGRAARGARRRAAGPRAAPTRTSPTCRRRSPRTAPASALLGELCAQHGLDVVAAYMGHVQDHAARAVAAAIARLPDGRCSRFADAHRRRHADRGRSCDARRRADWRIDFAGTGAGAAETTSTRRARSRVAAVLYVLRTLVGEPIPLNRGCLRPVELAIPPAACSIPGPERAVAGGNVETSQRVVDVLLARAGREGGEPGHDEQPDVRRRERSATTRRSPGARARARATGGRSGVHTHMTNTRITDPEVLEARFPVRLRSASRSGAARAARAAGAAATAWCASSSCSRRFGCRSCPIAACTAPFGLAGGERGARREEPDRGASTPAAAASRRQSGARLRIETPGGGGFGEIDPTGGDAG